MTTKPPRGFVAKRSSSRGARDLSVLPPGFVGPKVEAACRPVEAIHRRTCVESLLEVDGLVAGTAGTSISL